MTTSPSFDAVPPSLQSTSLTARGIHSRVLQGGPDLKASEAVVFVHGNPGSGMDWALLMQAMAPYSRVVALDMPGFGQADKPADFPYSVEAGAEFLADALAQLGVERAHLVLHDFGGPWGLVWAAMHPQHFASLVLINTGVLKGYRWHFMARIWRTPLLGEIQQWLTNRSGFKWVMGIGSPRGLPPDFVNRMYDELDKGTRHAILKLYRATSDIGGRSEELASILKPLGRSTLVVWGAADPYLPVRFAEQQRETFTNARVVVLKDSGHFPYADNPQAVAEAVVPFLRGQLAGQPAATQAAVGKWPIGA